MCNTKALSITGGWGDLPHWSQWPIGWLLARFNLFRLQTLSELTYQNQLREPNSGRKCSNHLVNPRCYSLVISFIRFKDIFILLYALIFFYFVCAIVFKCKVKNFPLFQSIHYIRANNNSERIGLWFQWLLCAHIFVRKYCPVISFQSGQFYCCPPSWYIQSFPLFDFYDSPLFFWLQFAVMTVKTNDSYNFSASSYWTKWRKITNFMHDWLSNPSF